MKEAPRVETLKPSRPGLLVLMPGLRRRYLPEDGQTVELSTYWRARLRSGDVVRVVPPTPQVAKPARAKEQN